jgi:hypothetical protein
MKTKHRLLLIKRKISLQEGFSMSNIQVTSQVAIRNQALLAINESLAALKAMKNGVKLNMKSISPETRTSLQSWSQGKQDQTLNWWN